MASTVLAEQQNLGVVGSHHGAVVPDHRIEPDRFQKSLGLLAELIGRLSAHQLEPNDDPGGGHSPSNVGQYLRRWAEGKREPWSLARVNLLRACLHGVVGQGRRYPDRIGFAKSLGLPID
jgi:hypothetical protein